jgi:hypothetical protein
LLLTWGLPQQATSRGGTIPTWFSCGPSAGSEPSTVTASVVVVVGAAVVSIGSATVVLVLVVGAGGVLASLLPEAPTAQRRR